MLILARYCRHSSMQKKVKEAKGLKTRNIYLFDKVYGIWRDHCWIEWKTLRVTKGRWYIIWWDPQHYIDKNGEYKMSITPSGKLWILPSENTMCTIRMYKNRIKKKYNIYIKTPRHKFIHKLIKYNERLS